MNAALKHDPSSTESKTTHVVVAHYSEEFINRFTESLKSNRYNIIRAESKTELESIARKQEACLFVLGGLNSSESSCINFDLVKKYGQRPTILVNKEGNYIDTVVGLENGADDAVYDNCCSRELAARVKNVLRRKKCKTNVTRIKKYKIYTFHGLVFDESENLLYDQNGDVVILHRTDLNLLRVLLHNSRKLMTRKEIIEEMFGSNYIMPDQSLSTQVFRLRKNLSKLLGGKNPIQTIYGIGYRFALDVEEQN